jgi:PadR family transcriptional regulator PadR
MRKTHALVEVALALLDDPDGRHWGYDISKRSGIRSGVLYPILHRMLDDELLTDGWEEQGKKPPRRYYELTPEGIERLGGLLEEARKDVRFRALTQRMA